MARTTIIKECCQIIDNHCEADCEAYGVGYYLDYKDDKIRFHRVTSSPTGETYSDGGIDTKSYDSSLESWDATIEDFINILVMFANDGDSHLKYEFGEDVECIAFRGIY